MLNLIAHRGKNNPLYNENTKSSILNTLEEDYIAGVEFDVRLTKDKKLVLVHDMMINRVSDGTGFVSNMTLKELSKFNFGTKERPSEITTLKSLLESINSDKVLLIEIKYEGLKPEEMVKEIYKIIKKHLYKNIYVMSFNGDVISLLKKKHPEIRCGILIGKIINNAYLDDNLDFIAISSYNTDEIKNYSKRIFVWAVFNKQTLNKLRQELSDNTYYIVDKPINFI